MSPAAILAMCALLLSPHTGSLPKGIAMAVVQSAQSAQDEPASTPQGSPSQPEASPANQQKNPDQPVSPATTQTPSPTPCPQSSPPGSTVKTDCQPVTPATGKAKKHNRAPKAGAPPGTGPTKTVVRNGSTTDPTVELAPSRNEQQASKELHNTNQLLASSDANLKRLRGRQLSPSQQDTVNQIKSYMEQARRAASSGDLQRAHNLAFKANLLSADLAGH